MFCSNCGKKNDDTSKFCEYCGSPLTKKEDYTAAPVTPLEVIPATKKKKGQKRGKKKSKLWLIICIILFLIAAAVGGGILLKKQQVRKQFNSAVATGDMYLEKLDYENAEAAYLKAIKIDPKRKDSYVRLINVYTEQKEYAKALKIFDKGERNLENGSDLYVEISDNREYWEKLVEAEEYEKINSLDGAEKAYLEALAIRADGLEAYKDLTDLYLNAGKYAETLKWLENVDKVNYPDKIEVENLCLMTEIYRLMEEEKYVVLLESFDDYIGKVSVELYHYFQNGEIVTEISSGKGMIVSSKGVYIGEIKNNQRSGRGRQFGRDSEAPDECYTLTKGVWSNDKANGDCTFSEVNIKDARETWTYIGNVKDNLFDGKITLIKMHPDGYEDTYIATAKNGTYELIRTDNNGMSIFAESIKTNWVVGETEKEELENNGIWAEY